jgi:hypothetical protein
VGYSHYWEGTPILSNEVIEDIAKIIEGSAVKIGDGLGEGKPILTPDEVRFNGWAADGEDYETFSVSASGGSDFCKTGREPYDVVVCAALLRIREESPDFRIESDGEWDDPDEWVRARELYFETFGRETTLTGLDD